MLWRVDYPTGRLRLLAPGAAVVEGDGAPPPATVLPAGEVRARADVPAGEPGRLLVLADPRDDGWAARLDGERLRPRTYGGWAQAFVLPADGGRVDIRHEQGVRTILLWLQLAAVAVVAVLALPQVRTREDDDLVADDAVSDDPVSDDATPGEPAARDPVPDESVAGSGSGAR